MSDSNKAVVAAFFRDVSAKGLEAAMRDHGTSDVTWWICGMGDVTGQMGLFSAAFQKIFDEKGMVITPLRMIADGDYVTVEAETESRLRSGGEYRNTISYWITFSGSKMARIAEYFNVGYSREAIGSSLDAAVAELMSA